LRRSKEQREVDRQVQKFTVELFKILFKKATPLNEKWNMLLFHILDNKVWSCYLLGTIAVVAILIVSSL